MKRTQGLFDGLSAASRARLRRRPQPRWTPPTLATLTDQHFSHPQWIYERKLDGVRCLVFRESTRVRLVSRNQKQMNAAWPELVEELRHQRCDDFVADGEVVAFEGNRTSFERLQGRIGLRGSEAVSRGIAVYLYLFDLLHLAGHDLTRLPLIDRKALLKSALSFERHVRYTSHRVGQGELFLEEACRKGWEGLIAKRSDATYEHRRSRNWLKFKCVNRQELVIGGFTEPQGSRHGFGALLVGYYSGGELRYAGKVGTGYDDATLHRLGARLKRLERARSCFAEPIRERLAHFVRPELVGEFGFTEWTRDGKLRHPRFLGLRPDKPPREVTRERPA